MSLKGIYALAAIAALGSSLAAPPARRQDDVGLLDDIFARPRNRGFGHRLPPQPIKQKRPAIYAASSTPVEPGAGDTRHPKYLHSAARRRRLATPTETSDGG